MPLMPPIGDDHRRQAGDDRQRSQRHHARAERCRPGMQQRVIERRIRLAHHPRTPQPRHRLRGEKDRREFVEPQGITGKCEPDRGRDDQCDQAQHARRQPRMPANGHAGDMVGRHLAVHSALAPRRRKSRIGVAGVRWSGSDGPAHTLSVFLRLSVRIGLVRADIVFAKSVYHKYRRRLIGDPKRHDMAGRS